MEFTKYVIRSFHSHDKGESPKSGTTLSCERFAALQPGILMGCLPSVTCWTACTSASTALGGIIKSVCVSFFSTIGIWTLRFGGKECRLLATSSPPGKEDYADGSTATQVSDSGPMILTWPLRTFVLPAVKTLGVPPFTFTWPKILALACRRLASRTLITARYPW